MKTRHCIFLIYCFSTGGPLFGQQKLFPQQFDQYFSDPVMNNPARVNLDNHPTKISFLRRSLSGPFKNVTSVLGSLHHRLSNEDKRNQQSLSLVIQNEKEGGFLNRTHIYVAYNWKTNLNETWELQAGGLFGVVNYFIKSSSTSAGGSDFAPDIHLGMWLNNETTGVGVAMNQVLNSTMAPFSASILLERYVSVGANQVFDLSDRFELCVHYNSIIRSFPNDHRINLILGYQSGLQAGVGIVVDKGVMVNIGLEEYQIMEKHTLNIGASYMVPTGRYASQLAKVLEVNLSIQ